MTTITLPNPEPGEVIVAGVSFLNGVARDVTLSPNRRVFFERMVGVTLEEAPEEPPAEPVEIPEETPAEEPAPAPARRTKAK